MTNRRPPRLPLDTEDLLDARARQRLIGVQLQRMFGEVAEEPIPSVFLDLLAQLDDRPPSVPEIRKPRRRADG